MPLLVSHELKGVESKGVKSKEVKSKAVKFKRVKYKGVRYSVTSQGETISISTKSAMRRDIFWAPVIEYVSFLVSSTELKI